MGQGAQDDGAGCMIVREAANLIRELGWKHRRSIRVVLYTAEESGIWGGQAFAEQRAEDYHWVAALESDIGNGRVEALSLDLSGFPVEASQMVIEQRVQDMQLALSPWFDIHRARGSGPTSGHLCGQGFRILVCVTTPLIIGPSITLRPTPSKRSFRKIWPTM